MSPNSLPAKAAQRPQQKMALEEFRASLAEDAPRTALSAPLAALWWDAKGDWARAHALVDELETVEGWPSTPTCTAGLSFER